MLGTDTVEVLRRRGHDVTAAGRAELDVTDRAEVDRAVKGHDVVVNCAAWTAVDDAEAQETQALRVNGEAPGLLARAAASEGATLVHLSTDYVFDGSARAPYSEDVPLAPGSAYGRSKAAGEAAVRAFLPERHLLVRTAWLYGANGPCFPRTIARLAREGGSVAVVADQVGAPTWTRDVAVLVAELVESQAPPGTYHATSSGQASWFDFAQAVVGSAGLDPAIVERTTSDSLDRPAPRPAYSVLGHGALVSAGLAPIGDWRARWAEAADEVLAGDGQASA
jgi:dTDP-4-dehydrorhamnose reductase